MRPIVLAANQPPRFYRGGDAIARFRGTAPAGDHAPEDWVGSTTSIMGAAPLGLTRLPDGRLLRDAIANDPEGYLGGDHVDAFGPDPLLLVKLLDAGQRLPVHVHPDRAFARSHLGSRYGKSEAWLVLHGGTLHVGFRSDVSQSTLRGWFEQQDVTAMLAASNEVQVERGDCVFVPAGTPHAIGAGVFMVEVQEPSDSGVMLEWDGFTAEERATMGLPVKTALEAVHLSAVTPATLEDWTCRSAAVPETRPARRSVLPPGAAPFFRAEWLRAEASLELEPSFSILVVIAGAGRLATPDAALAINAGMTLLVPYAAGAIELKGPVEAARCLPPSPGTGR